MEHYGKTLIIHGDVKFMGEGQDPKDNVGFQMWENALISTVKLNYIQHKHMKKHYGKMRAREIAFGRKLVKSIQTLYTRKPKIVGTI